MSSTMSKVAIATQKLLNSSGYTTFIRKKGTNLSNVSVKEKKRNNIYNEHHDDLFGKQTQNKKSEDNAF